MGPGDSERQSAGSGGTAAILANEPSLQLQFLKFIMLNSEMKLCEYKLKKDAYGIIELDGFADGLRQFIE